MNLHEGNIIIIIMSGKFLRMRIKVIFVVTKYMLGIFFSSSYSNSIIKNLLGKS